MLTNEGLARLNAYTRAAAKQLAREFLTRDERQGATVDDGHGPHPFDQEFCKEGCQPV